MASISLSGHTGIFSGGLRGIIDGIANAYAAYRVARRSRHEIEELASMPDNLLADIAINRQSVDAALAQPFWRDPSDVLVNSRR